MSRWRIPAFLFALLIVTCCAVTVFMMENSLHVARRVRPSEGTPVQITAQDGATLRASWLVPAHRFDRCVMVLHGIGDSRASSVGFAPMFLGNGYAALAPDSRAHGESEGSLVTYGLLERHDTLAWAKWLRNKGCRKIYGLGESLGASVLLQVEAEEPVFSAIVAESAFADLQDAAEARLMHMVSPWKAHFASTCMRIYTRVIHGIDLRDASPLRTISRVKTPVLLIHGLDDDQTPPDHSRRLAEANPAFTSLWLVPGVKHASAYSNDPLEWRKRVLDWFASH